MNFSLVSRLRIAAATFLIVLLAPGNVLADAQSAPIGDVNESYRLLINHFYKPVTNASLIEAARTALNEEAGKRHVSLTLRDLPSADDEDGAIAWLDDSISDAAQASHTTTTPYAYVAIAAMAKAVNDRWTQFMTPDEYRAFNAALDPEKISGIGVLIRPDPASNLITLNYVVPGTPADRAGLENDDTLVSIDGASTKGMKTEDASKLLRGKAGTSVRLEVTRGTDPVRTYAVTRSEIQPPTVLSRMLPQGIGYVFVLAFGKETPDQFDEALNRLHDQGAKALVVDLRDDGGGYVDSALEMAGRFIANHPLLTVQQRGYPDTTIPARDDVSVHVPVTVLVNQYTASASEIMAGALQDDGVAALVGARTFGKGVMQTLTPLADGAAIKITTAHYLTPLRRDINLKGIDPDVPVDEPKGSRFGEVAHDPQLRAALAVLQKKIAEAGKI